MALYWMHTRPYLKVNTYKLLHNWTVLFHVFWMKKLRQFTHRKAFDLPNICLAGWLAELICSSQARWLYSLPLLTTYISKIFVYSCLHFRGWETQNESPFASSFLKSLQWRGVWARPKPELGTQSVPPLWVAGTQVGERSWNRVLNTYCKCETQIP